MAEVKRFMKLDEDFLLNDKVKKLRRAHGMEGVGIYLSLLTLVSRYTTTNYEIPVDELENIATEELFISTEVLENVIQTCLNVGLFVYGENEKTIYSIRRKEDLMALSELIDSRRRGGIKSGETRRQQAVTSRSIRANNELAVNSSSTQVQHELNTNLTDEDEDEEYRENSRDKSIEPNGSFSYSTRNCAEKKPDDESVLVECANTCSTGVQQVLSKCQAEEEEEEREEKEQDKEEKEELLRRKKNNSKSIELNSSHSYIVRKRKIEDEKPENESVLPEKPEKASKGKKSTSLNHPSSLDEVKEYAREMGYTYCNCREWWDFNEARGWILNNGRPIKDWKAQLRYSYSKGYSRSKETEDSYDGRPFNPNLHNSTDEELETMFMTDEEKAEWEAKKKAGEKNVGA